MGGGLFGVNNRSAGNAAGAYSIGTASYPVTGFPTSAYRGSNKWAGGGVQSQPSAMAGAFSNNAVAVDPKHEFALFNDVQRADIGEADRESPQRSVRNNPFPAQTDAPEQLREQVVRLTICVEAERGFLKRWRIGKLLRRSEQIGWRRWTIGKMFRRSGHCRNPFLELRSTSSEWSDQSGGPGITLGRSVRCQFLPLAMQRRRKFARHSRPGLGPPACVNRIAPDSRYSVRKEAEPDGIDSW